MNKPSYSSRENFEIWAEANGYPDYDDWIDQEEEPYKRTVSVNFYLKHVNGTYAQFSCYVDYDWGADNFTLEREGLKRIEEEVLVKQIKYVKE